MGFSAPGRAACGRVWCCCILKLENESTVRSFGLHLGQGIQWEYVPLLSILRHSGADWFGSYCLSLGKMPSIPCLWQEQEALGPPWSWESLLVMEGSSSSSSPAPVGVLMPWELLTLREGGATPRCSPRGEELRKAKTSSACWAWSCAKPCFSMLSSVRKIKALLRGGNNNYSLELTPASEVASSPF